MTLDRRGFRVIRGSGAKSTSVAVERELVVVEKRVWTQLKFAFASQVSCRERLLSIGIDGIDFDSFRRLIIDAGVRHVIDVRHLASFRGRGFSPTLVDSTFREVGVAYERCFDLVNRYLGTSRNPHLVLQKYARHLRQEHGAAVARLVTYMQRGPILLLGREAAHFGTEREIIVQLIAEMHVPLEVFAPMPRQVPDQSFAWTSFLIASQVGKSRKRERMNKKPDADKGSSQLSLPDVSGEDD
jgi:hypothetical protein